MFATVTRPDSIGTFSVPTFVSESAAAVMSKSLTTTRKSRKTRAASRPLDSQSTLGIGAVTPRNRSGGASQPAMPIAEAVAPRRLTVAEFRRRLWHMAPGLLTIVAWSIPHEDPLSPTFKWIAFSIIAGLSLALLKQFHTLLRRNEKSGFSATFGYGCSIMATLLLFPAHAELGMTVLAVLAFGDGSATLGGILLGGRTLPWDRDKTWSGTLCFVLVGGPLAALAYLAESQPTAPILVAVVCGMTAATVAALAESLPSRINDNIRVGIAAAVSVAAAHAVTVGL